MSWVTLPIDVDIKQLDDGDGTEATMMRHHACWHKTYHLKFNQIKLGKRIILIFDEDIGSALRKACNIDELQCTRHVLHKLCIIKNCSVYGSFKPSHEQDVIPPCLMGLVRMILDGPNIKHQSEVAAPTTRAVLDILTLYVEYG